MLSQFFKDQPKVGLVFILASSTNQLLQGNGQFSQIWSHISVAHLELRYNINKKEGCASKSTRYNKETERCWWAGCNGVIAPHPFVCVLACIVLHCTIWLCPNI